MSTAVTAAFPPTTPAPLPQDPPPRRGRELTVADLAAMLGDIPARRVRTHPAPGTATEEDLLAAEPGNPLPCELINGVLVEKDMAFVEGFLAALLIHVLREFAVERNLGRVGSPDVMYRLGTGLVRLPDVSFISWERLRSRPDPDGAVGAVAPELAVEIFSPGNTEAEMAAKRRDYFAAGVLLVWIVKPQERVVEVFTGPEERTVLREGETLTGGRVLEGFSLNVSALFAEADAVRAATTPPASPSPSA
jgi:Uma2 family endonuclease